MPAQRDAAQLYERYLAPMMAPFVAAGVDVDEAMLAEAAERATAEGLTIAWRRARAEQLPFADASFDAVMCQQALQFFRDPAAALVEMARVTRPGGRVAATVWAPMDHTPYMQAQYLALQSVVDDERVASLREAFAFSYERLVEVFAGAGLSEVTVTEVVADVTLPDFGQFVVGHLQALPRDAAAAPARAGGAEEVGALIVQRLSELVQPDGSATVALASYLASGVR